MVEVVVYVLTAPEAGVPVQVKKKNGNISNVDLKDRQAPFSHGSLALYNLPSQN